MLNLLSIIPDSRVNGPGTRFTIWFQGCNLGCIGCFNPETHSFNSNIEISVNDVVESIFANKDKLDGISISGGEPFLQPDSLLELLKRTKEETRLSILVFSGYNLDEIENQPLGREILNYIDVLIAGRYDHEHRHAKGLRGSSNQKIHLLTSRYTISEIENTPDAEITISPEGKITISGIDIPKACGTVPIFVIQYLVW